MNIHWNSRTGIALFVFLAIIAFFLITEHLAHIIPVLPWLLLLVQVGESNLPLKHRFHNQ